MASRRARYAQLSLLPATEQSLSIEAPPVAEAVTHGEVFTRQWVVELILDLVNYSSADDLAQQVALEPACGTGAFLVPMVQRLSQSLRTHGRDLNEAVSAIRAYDLLPTNVSAAREAVVAALIAEGWEGSASVRMAGRWVSQADFLLHPQDAHSADFVVGNPPYIRLEDVPQARSEAYRAACPAMGGRADVFIGFYEIGLRALKEGGRLGYICADRWMRNAYGKGLRQLIAASYAVDAVVVMHDVDAFEEPVAAYPAITVLRAGPQAAALIADTTRDFGEHTAADLVKYGCTPATSCRCTAPACLPHGSRAGSRQLPGGRPAVLIA